MNIDKLNEYIKELEQTINQEKNFMRLAYKEENQESAEKHLIRQCECRKIYDALKMILKTF